MGLDARALDRLRELFEPVDGAEIRRMFGGAGVFRDGLMFALSTDEGRVALKVDDINRPRFVDEGCEPWEYLAKSSRARRSMGYWYMPERLLDDPEALREWADEAFEAARRADAAKPASKRKATR